MVNDSFLLLIPPQNFMFLKNNNDHWASNLLRTRYLYDESTRWFKRNAQYCGRWKKISSYKHAPDSDWLSRHSCLNVACTVCPSFLSDVLRFLFVQLDEEQSIRMKGEDTRQIGCLHSGCCCLHEEMWRQTQDKHAIFTHK
jgi:hypothetical protein